MPSQITNTTQPSIQNGGQEILQTVQTVQQAPTNVVLSHLTPNPLED